ncbi:MAG: nitrogen regulation protein NR(I) [Alphaproteobacteria bacterium TMED87]|nr:nitrogen regulation protein NR(I) [Rhodospirillaceae bacterium]OUV09067.1 MAG: nitrogen regulation protein NR(I) [Alphaproteobacteria bacterium TMED87]
MNKYKILIAEDDTSVRTVLNQALGRAGYIVKSTGNISTLWDWIDQGEGNLVITDVLLPDENGLDLLPKIKKNRPDLRVIVMSAQNTLLTAVKAVERGAFEYVPKPFDLSELLLIVKRALETSHKSNLSNNDELIKDRMPILGRSQAMQDVYRSVARLINTDLTVMISGESGTGKELVAKALHDYGRRRNGPFIAINMAAIPKELIESELFGYEKGAFTGATQRSSGKFEQANGGTLFLDEIGDMPADAQTRLLRVLQEGEYTTVGGNTPNKTNVRIIAATHRDLTEMIKMGLFREDLYYRLNVVPLKLPSLRQRVEDIPELVNHFLLQALDEGLSSKTIDNTAMDKLKSYNWPGNVRELENLIKRIAVLYSEENITGNIIEIELATIQQELSISSKRINNINDFIEDHVKNYFSRFPKDKIPDGFYNSFLKEIEKPLIMQTLNITEGNQIKASKILGLNRNTLRKKIKDLGIVLSRSIH